MVVHGQLILLWPFLLPSLYHLNNLRNFHQSQIIVYTIIIIHGTEIMCTAKNSLFSVMVFDFTQFWVDGRLPNVDFWIFHTFPDPLTPLMFLNFASVYLCLVGKSIFPVISFWIHMILKEISNDTIIQIFQLIAIFQKDPEVKS